MNQTNYHHQYSMIFILEKNQELSKKRLILLKLDATVTLLLNY